MGMYPSDWPRELIAANEFADAQQFTQTDVAALLEHGLVVQLETTDGMIVCWAEGMDRETAVAAMAVIKGLHVETLRSAGVRATSRRLPGVRVPPPARRAP